MTKTPASPSTNDDSPETPTLGKGRATPSRAEQEAARRRPLAATSKEAKAAAKSDLEKLRRRAHEGFAAGEERYLPTRDKGPQRRWVRDYVDAGWHMSEYVMAVMLIVILLALVPEKLTIGSLSVAGLAYYVMIGYMVLSLIGMVILSIRVKRKIAQRFGKDRMERGLGWYAAMRSMQMRFMRLPKPQVKLGDYPK